MYFKMTNFAFYLYSMLTTFKGILSLKTILRIEYKTNKKKTKNYTAKLIQLFFSKHSINFFSFQCHLLKHMCMNTCLFILSLSTMHTLALKAVFLKHNHHFDSTYSIYASSQNLKLEVFLNILLAEKSFNCLVTEF